MYTNNFEAGYKVINAAVRKSKFRVGGYFWWGPGKALQRKHLNLALEGCSFDKENWGSPDVRYGSLSKGLLYISVYSLEPGQLRIFNSVPGQILYNYCAISMFFPQLY